MVSEVIIRRLAFIRYLYGVAVQQSRQPEPMSSASILSFHDSIELFLQLSSEYMGIDKTSSFMEYWEITKSRLPAGGLSQKTSIKRLNEARVALKHFGRLPSRLDIEEYRASTTNFFKDNTTLVFGIDFNEISLVHLIQYIPAKNLLNEAQKLLSDGNIEQSLQKIALSFDMIIEDYENRKQTIFGRSPFFFGKSMALESSLFLGIKDHKLRRFIDITKESIEAIQQAMKVLSLGIDYRQFTKFKLLTPTMIKPLGGGIIFAPIRSHSLTEEDCRFCYDFVIESAIRLQDFDYNISEHV